MKSMLGSPLAWRSFWWDPEKGPSLCWLPLLEHQLCRDKIGLHLDTLLKGLVDLALPNGLETRVIQRPSNGLLACYHWEGVGVWAFYLGFYFGKPPAVIVSELNSHINVLNKWIMTK